MALYDKRFCPIYGAQGRPEQCDRDCGFYDRREGICSLESISRHLGKIVEIEEERDIYEGEKHE